MSQAGRPRGSKNVTTKTYLQLAPDVEDELENLLVNDLIDNVTLLKTLAQGGFVVIEKQFMPVGMIYRKFSGTDMFAFPELVAKDPLQEICVLRIERTEKPNITALIDLINRTMGKPGETPNKTAMLEELKFIFDQSTGSTSIDEIRSLGDEVSKAIEQHDSTIQTTLPLREARTSDL